MLQIEKASPKIKTLSDLVNFNWNYALKKKCLPLLKGVVTI